MRVTQVMARNDQRGLDVGIMRSTAVASMICRN